MKTWMLAICACLALGLTAVGCGDEDSGDSGDSAPTTEQAETTTGAEQPAGSGAAAEKKKQETTEVDVVDIDYEPKDVTIAVGDIVKWTNTGQLQHTVTADSQDTYSFSSGNMSNGDTFVKSFVRPGTVEYYCKIHPQQQGTITIE